MLRLLVFAVLLLGGTISHAQDYNRNPDKAARYRTEGKFDSAITEYHNTYITDPSNSANIYSMATAYAQLRQPDSCLLYLYKAVKADLSDEALSDPDLYPVRKDIRWESFEQQLIAALQQKYNNPYKDTAYARRLWLIGTADQAYYADIQVAEQKLGKSSPVVRALWDLKTKINTENTQELEALIAKKGWPKISQVGPNAATAAFLVIQHSDEIKQKKYLPAIKQLCETHEASWQSYALMYDRIQVSEHKPQKYGSQVQFNIQKNAFELFPLENEAKVDEWRQEAGMGPLAAYVAHWGITFEPKKK